MKRRIKYQSIKVRFPRRLYLMTSWFVDAEGRKLLFAHHTLYKNPKYALKGAQEIYKHLGIDNVEVLEWAMINVLNFTEKKPLRKEFWHRPAFKFDETERFKQFTHPYLDTANYKLLVTPHNAELGIFTGPMPFRKDANQEDIDLFMMTSDWPVDKEADCYAFYSLSETISINIFSGKTYHKDFKSKPKKMVLS